MIPDWRQGRSIPDIAKAATQAAKARRWYDWSIWSNIAKAAKEQTEVRWKHPNSL